MASYRKPIIGVPASILEVGENQIPAHTSGKRIIEALVTFANCIPLIIPARADASDTSSLLDNFDGIFLNDRMPYGMVTEIDLSTSLF